MIKISMQEPYHSFLEIWHTSVYYLTGLSIIAALLIFIIYKLSLVSKKELKDKYDLISRHEITWYKIINFLLGAALFFYLNYTRQETVQLNIIWFFIRLFVSFCFATLYIYVLVLILNYYYPKPLSKKLKKLRYTPRVNPNNKKAMKLLSEEEEDAYLDEGMQAEEDVFSVDYDVWIDPETEYIKIEKYKGHLTALECDRCGFQTLKLNKEEIIKEPSEVADGEIKKEYECTYCGRIKRNVVRLSRASSENSFSGASSGVLIDNPLEDTNIVVSVKLELMSNKGIKKEYEFQNKEEASKFLKEFSFDSLEE